MERLERIVYMEQVLDEGMEAVAALSEALEKYSSLQGKLQQLIAYYESKQWRQDYDDDNAGKIPGNLKRGVLSEDAVYDFLTEDARLLERLRALVNQKSGFSDEGQMPEEP